MVLEKVIRMPLRGVVKSEFGGSVQREGENLMTEALPDLVALKADNCVRVSCSQ